MISKKYLKTLYKRLGFLLTLPFLHLIGILARAFKIGNELSPVLDRYGYSILKKHYYLGIPVTEDQIYTSNPSEIVGVHMVGDQEQLGLIDQLVTPYSSELSEFPISQTEGKLFYWTNGSFMAGDAHIYYGMIRHYRPHHIIEIGSGFSTIIAATAIRHNAQPSELTCIEPYPRPILREIIPELTTLIEKKIQQIPIEKFQALQSNDILFIDSTHVLKMGSDVWWEYCEILPRLASGVWIHIHDISLPYHYPSVYFKNQYHWNEQYLLQALLTFSNHFEIVWAGTYLNRKYPERVRAAFMPFFDDMKRVFPQSEPCSIWLRVR